MSALLESPFFGVTITIVAYWIGVKIQQKTKLAICNYMLIAVVLLVAVLVVFDIPYESYYVGGNLINLFLGPATACMAVSVYAKLELLKKNWLPVLVGCTVGVATSLISIFVMCRLFGLDREMTASLLPKSVTTPIATAISQDHGGLVAITVAAVTVTGILGNLIAPMLVRLFRIKDPWQWGWASVPAAMLWERPRPWRWARRKGAMSGLAIGLCGILTTVAALGFELFL